MLVLRLSQSKGGGKRVPQSGRGRLGTPALLNKTSAQNVLQE